MTINQEDYELMIDIVDNYNKIVGKRDITKALITKVGIKFSEKNEFNA